MRLLLLPTLAQVLQHQFSGPWASAASLEPKNSSELLVCNAYPGDGSLAQLTVNGEPVTFVGALLQQGIGYSQCQLARSSAPSWSNARIALDWEGETRQHGVYDIPSGACPRAPGAPQVQCDFLLVVQRLGSDPSLAFQSFAFAAGAASQVALVDATPGPEAWLSFQSQPSGAMELLHFGRVYAVDSGAYEITVPRTARIEASTSSELVVPPAESMQVASAAHYVVLHLGDRSLDWPERLLVVEVSRQEMQAATALPATVAKRRHLRGVHVQRNRPLQIAEERLPIRNATGSIISAVAKTGPSPVQAPPNMYVPLAVAGVVGVYFLYMWLPKVAMDPEDMFDDWPRPPCPCPCMIASKELENECMIQFEGSLDDEVELVVGKKKKKVQLGYSYGRACRKLDRNKKADAKKFTKFKISDDDVVTNPYWIVFSDLTNARLPKPYRANGDLERVTFLEAWGIFGNEAGDTETFFNMYHLDAGITVILIWFVLGFTFLWYMGWVQPVLKQLATYAFLVSVVAVPVLGLLGWILSKLCAPISKFLQAIFGALAAINRLKSMLVDGFSDSIDDALDWVGLGEESSEEEANPERPHLPCSMLLCKKCITVSENAKACKHHKPIYEYFKEHYLGKELDPNILACRKCRIHNEHAGKEDPCNKHKKDFATWKAGKGTSAAEGTADSGTGCFKGSKRTAVPPDAPAKSM